jgi:hypothetical protein
MLMRMVHHQSHQIPTAIMEIMIHMIPMMKSSWITFKLNLARKRLILRKFYAKDAIIYAKDAKIPQKTLKLRKRR